MTRRRYDGLSDEARFWKYVQRGRAIHPILRTPCWLWTGSLTGGDYGQFRLAGGKRPAVQAHCYSFQLVFGEIAPGMEIDHMCRVRHCVNPHHLDLVTRSENIKRGYVFNRSEYCKRGHVLDRQCNGKRYCRTCNRDRMRVRREAAKHVQV